MKKIYSVLFLCLLGFGMQAASFTVTISGFAYSPSVTACNVGDVITIQASSVHPLAQVDGTVWAANGTTTLTGGWGIQNADYTFTVSAAGSTFFVCNVHGPSGMKGRIDATNPAGMFENNLMVRNFNLFPNPATHKLNISFTSSNEGNVSAKLFNVLGQEISTLIQENNLPAENHSFNVELPATLPGGPYFVVLTSNERRITKRLVISK